MINLLKYDDAANRTGMIDVKGEFVAWAVWGEAQDYVEETSVRLRQLARQLFRYPIYVTFESYYDTSADILAETDLSISYTPSGRTVLTQTGKEIFQAEVPTFTVTILNEQMLHKVFENWFHLAFDNNLWVVYQHDTLTYEDGFAAISLQENETILVTEHDAQGFTFITNNRHFDDEQRLKSTLQEAFRT